MKVAIIIDSLASGGSERQAALAAIEVARRGADVHIITVHARNDFAESLARASVKCVTLGKLHFARLLKIASIAGYLRKEKFDIVHCFKSRPSTYGRLAAKMARIPTVFGGFRQNRPDGRLINWLNRLLTRGTSGWIVNSQSARDMVSKALKIAPDRVFVVPNAIDPGLLLATASTRDEATRLLGLPDRTPIVTIVAHLRREKNHLMFLRVARKILDLGVEAIFLCAGEGPEKEKLVGHCRAMELQTRVRFLDLVSDVPTLLKATDVCVLTSLSEALPNALIEASFLGVPCVSTDNGGAAEVIRPGHTGFIVPVNDDDAMAHRVVQLIQDKSLRQRIGESARLDALRRFALDRSVTSLLNVYNGMTRKDI